MKNKLKYLFHTLIIIGLLSGCNDYDWDVNHNTELTPVTIESDNMNIHITDDNLSNSIRLGWTKSSAKDYSKVFYEILFYTSADFGNTEPFYTVSPGNIQTDNYAEITNLDLNIIAERAGIKPETNGEIYWRVRISNGINQIYSDNFRTISLSRPTGFAYIPEQIYVMGSATTADESLKNAIPMVKAVNPANDKQTGVFELFMQLGEGEFYFIEKLADGYRQFSVSAGKIVESNNKNTAVKKDAIHRLRVDFNKQTAEITEITEVGVWYSPINGILTTLSLESSEVPVWSGEKYLEILNDETGFADYRYKFRLQEKDATGNLSYSFWGYSGITAPAQTETTPSDYFYLYEVDNSQSNYCYKFNNRGEHDEATLKFTVDFRSSITYFTHSIEVVEN